MAKIITYASGSSISYYHEQCFEEALKKLSMKIGDPSHNPTIGIVDDLSVTKHDVCIRCVKCVRAIED